MISNQMVSGLMLVAGLMATGPARSDTVTDWNKLAADITVAQVQSPVLGNHILAVVQTSVFLAVNAITQTYEDERITIDARPGASVDTAIAVANRNVLLQLVPAQKAAIDQAYEAALARVTDGEDARSAGIAVGEQAATAAVGWYGAQKMRAIEPYRPVSNPGVYIPTVDVAAWNWGARPTWILKSSDQLRPPPPPALNSQDWAKDYDEVNRLGGLNSTQRSAEQTEIALFWQATVPTIYYPVLRSVAQAPGREITRNARLLAIAGQAMDDALIAVFDAKYFYRFWRPVTAIRNGDRDENEATTLVPDWEPLIATPMHPEYPCAHCIVSGTVAGLIRADLGDEPCPLLSTTSPALPGVTRSWKTPDEFAQEVADARVFDGVHYRTSAVVGTAMGARLAAMAMPAR